MKSIVFILFFITQFVTYSSVAFAGTQVGQQKVGKELILPVDPRAPATVEEFSHKIAPKNTQSSGSASAILNEVADNTVAVIWDESAFKRTSVGQFAKSVEDKMNVEGGFQDTNQISHAFSFKVLAMQTLARLEYKGWINAAVNYNARAATTEAEIVDQISMNQDLVLSHALNAQESKSQVSLRWNW